MNYAVYLVLDYIVNILSFTHYDFVVYQLEISNENVRILYNLRISHGLLYYAEEYFVMVSTAARIVKQRR